MNRFQILKKSDSTEPCSASMSFEDFKKWDEERKLEEQKQQNFSRLQNDLSHFISTGQGGEVISQGITERLNRNSLTRNIFNVDNDPSHNVFTWRFEDPTQYVAVINAGGNPELIDTRNNQLVLPEFLISATVEISVSELRGGSAKFDGLFNQIASTIQRVEESSAFRLFDLCATHSRNFTRLWRSGSFDANNVSRSFHDAMTLIERHNLSVNNIFINSLNFNILRALPILSPQITPGNVIPRDNLWGISLYRTPNVPSNSIFLTSENFGMFRPKHINSSINRKFHAYGGVLLECYVHQTPSLVCFNSRAIARIDL